MEFIKSNTIEELIDDRTKFERKIILILAENKGNWVSTNYLADCLQIQSNTVSKYYKHLIFEIRQLNNQKFQLELSRNKGVRLSIGLGEDIGSLIGYIISKSPAIELLENIFLESFDSISQYAQSNFISEATVRRYLARIKKYFSSYDARITRDRIRLTGDEKQIRILMSIFYWQVYGGVSWPFKTVSECEMESLVTRFIGNWSLGPVRVPFIYKRQLMYYFAEAIIRTRKKRFVHYEKDWDAEIKSSEVFNAFNTTLQKFHGTLNTCLQEVAFHYIVFLTIPDTSKIVESQVLIKFIAHQKEQKTLAYQASELLIQKMNLDPEKLTYPFLANIYSFHIFAKYFKGFNSDMFGHIYSPVLTKRYPELTKKVDYILNELYNNSKNPIFLEKAYLLTTYIKLYSAFGSINQYEKEIVLLLESDISCVMTKVIKEKILGVFSSRFNLFIIDDLQPHDPKEVDIVLTTVSIEKFSEVYKNARVFSINSELSLNDFAMLETIMARLFDEKNQKLQTSRSMVKSAIH